MNIRYDKIIVDGYRGRHFTLKIPEDKNNVIFQMDGNTGKTTTIELLRWCFSYKASEANGKFRHMWNNPAHVLDWRKDGLEQTCSIKVFFSDEEGNKYKYERTTTGRYDKKKASEECRGDIIDTIYDSLEINNGVRILENDSVFEFLNSKFKLGVSSPFAFFDGEKARDMMRMASSDIDQLLRIVEERTSHTTLNDYSKKLNTLKERLLSEASAALTDAAEIRRRNQYIRLDQEIQKIGTKIQNLEVDIKVNKGLIHELDDELSTLNSEIIKQKTESLKKRLDTENSIDTKKKEITNERYEIFKKNNDLINMNSFDSFNEVKNQIREYGKLPEPYRSELIDQCLNSTPPTCMICGRKLDEKSSEQVKKLSQQVATHGVHQFLTEKFKEDSLKLYDFKEARKRILENIEELNKLEEKLKEIDLKPEDLEMLKEKDEKKNKLKRLSDKEANLLANLSREKERLTENNNTLQELLGRMTILSKKRPLLDEIKRTEELLIKTQESMRNKTIEVIGDVISKAVSNILGDRFSATLTKENGLMLGEEEVYGPETGGYSGRLILSYLFAEAMSQVNPIIIDTPVGNVGSHRKALANHLIENHSQVILLCLPTEIQDFAEYFETDIIEILNMEAL